jgi:ferredoxin
MAARVNPRLIDELERYGAQDVAKCYHCGNCSAVCPFSREPFLFPRRSMRFLQLGLEDRLRGTLEPWLCYYCGECSDQCPRGAEPGETMMSVRRWLTAQYDLTGLSRLFYRSWKAEVLALVLCALVVGTALVWWGLSHGSLHVYDGPGAFLSSEVIHVFDWFLAGGLALLLGMNCVNMWWLTIGRRRDLPVRPFDYVAQLWLLPWHFFTQSRYRSCDRREPWLRHLVLVLSYVTLFVLIVFFLPVLQEGPAIRWEVHALGYLATIGLVTTVVLAMRSRYRKAEPLHRYSHETDWIFLVLLLLVALTGIAQHTLHRTGAIPAANVMYVLHLMIAVPMLLIEVPFGKWAHLAYRPLSMYLAAIESAAIARLPDRGAEDERARAA